MAVKVPQASFAKGELDPQLQKRVTLAAYDSGLSTGRNACISRTGSIFSRPGRKWFAATDSLGVGILTGPEAVGYSPPGTGIMTEWTDLAVTTHDFLNETVAGPVVHALTIAQLRTAHFESSGNFIYVFVQGQKTLKFDYVNGAFASGPFIFDYPFSPTSPSLVSITENGAPAGHFVDYYVTVVKNGEEMGALVIAGSSTYNLPIAAGQSNTIIVKVSDATVAAGSDGVTEVRVYRRPQSGGSFGYIGSSSSLATSGADTRATFEDLGQEADYTIGPPAFVNRPQAPTVANQDENWYAKTGCIYQQRLCMGDLTDFVARNKEAIISSRPGYLNNFYRDYPLNDASAYKFRAGSGGSANVLRMVDADGLVVFTTRGVFLHSGQLSPDNLGLVKKGKWRIKEDVTALPVPGGLFFVDEATNTIRNLVWDDRIASYNGKEVSVYSNHLFKEREIVSWGFHEGADPLLYVAFDDGQFAMFTYEFDQEMRAWTRGDSSGNCNVKQIVPTDVAGKTFYLMEKDGNYWWELSVERFITAADLEDDPEAHMGEKTFYADAIISHKILLNDDLAGADTFALTPVVGGEWDGPLTLTCGTSAIFTDPGPGAVGEVHRVFDPDSRVYYDLTVIARATDNQITVTPDRELNSSLNSNLRLYRTFTSFSSLTFFEGEYPAVMVDGEVVCSPNNDRDDYENVQVSGGVLTLPGGMRGAIMHVGRPIVGDVGTLKVTTVEQAPTQHESLTVNKVYIDVLQSRGLYIGHKFPESESVANMHPIEDEAVNYNQEAPVVANRYDQPKTRTYEITMPGEWDNGGEIALRQVDPVHFHITAITLDVDVERRSDR